MYLQVCSLLHDEKTIEHEFGSLLEVRDNYPKYVLYKTSTFKGDYEGIPAVSVESWLRE